MSTGVTLAHGFSAVGITAGTKASGKPDLALVRNDGPLQHAAAVFTTNRVAAAPVHWSRAAIEGGQAAGVLLQSGGGHGCPGAAG